MSAPETISIRDPLWRRVTRLLTKTIVFPVHSLVIFRRSITPASVTLLFIGIISMNILWGYPWIGMFAVCFSVMVVGFAASRVMRPKLDVDFSLPRSVPADQTLQMRMHLKNHRTLPALQLNVQVEPDRIKKRFWGGYSHSDPKATAQACRVESPPIQIPIIAGNDFVSANVAVCYLHRGIRLLPDVRIKSYFPFHLFESTRRIGANASIAVTPRLLSVGDDITARGKLADLSGWAHRLSATDAYDYAGSREYQVGMPVRRWDFASWARLGRPIVREFHAQGVETVLLIVDTGIYETTESAKYQNPNKGDRLETLLSFAATAITEMRHQTVDIRMFITGESFERFETMHESTALGFDLEQMLIRLAEAETVPMDEADEAIDQIAELMPNTPMCVLTSREASKASGSSECFKRLVV